ncbi:MAG: GRP family sugar transporter [Planctomycetaceae bacterium]|nr:GRP family sugar transporter [Planctomycetaceae bacterium]
MNILLGLLPALCWGIMPLVVSRIGGKPANQILGTTVGTLAVAAASLAFHHSPVSTGIFLLSALSGALWVVGQIGQYTAFGRIGVSQTMPLSTGLQLVGTTLIGVLVFHEWKGTTAEIVGFSALALVVAGIYLTTRKDKSAGGGGRGGLDGRTLLLLFLTNFGYLAYSSIPEVAGAAGMAIFFPQAIGMAAAAVVYLFLSKNAAAFAEWTMWKNVVTGLLFASESLAYILSANRNGIATGFVLSQLSVVISTLGGIFLLKEHKTRRELIATIIGLVLIVVGSAATAMIRH